MGEGRGVRGRGREECTARERDGGMNWRSVACVSSVGVSW